MTDIYLKIAFSSARDGIKGRDRERKRERGRRRDKGRVEGEREVAIKNNFN